MAQQIPDPKDPAQAAPKSATEAPPDSGSGNDDDARLLLGRLPKMSAPVDLTKTVPDLINRRSRGRFFGRRSLGDRLPFEWISLTMLVAIAILYAVLKLIF